MLLKNKITNVYLQLKYPIKKTDNVYNSDDNSRQALKIILVSVKQEGLLENLIHYDYNLDEYFTIYDVIKPEEILLDSDSYINKYSKGFNSIYSKYITLFPDITKDDLIFVTMMLFSEITGRMNSEIIETLKKRNEYISKVDYSLKEYFNKKVSDVFFLDTEGNVEFYMNLANINVDINTETPMDIYKIIK